MRSSLATFALVSQVACNPIEGAWLMEWDAQRYAEDGCEDRPSDEGSSGAASVVELTLRPYGIRAFAGEPIPDYLLTGTWEGGRLRVEGEDSRIRAVLHGGELIGAARWDTWEAALEVECTFQQGFVAHRILAPTEGSVW